MENLNRLFDFIKTIGFFDRLFNWSKVKNLLIDSAGELQKLNSNIETQKGVISKLETENYSLTKDLKVATESAINAEAKVRNLEMTGNENNLRIEKLTGDYSASQATIEAQRKQIETLMSDSRLIADRNAHLIADNKKLAEDAATNNETISVMSKRRKELDIELVELKKDFQSLETIISEYNIRIEKLTGDYSGSQATVEGQRKQIEAISSDNRLILERNTNLISQNKKLAEDTATNIEMLASLSQRKGELDNALIEVRTELQMVKGELNEKAQHNTELLKDEEFRKQEHSNSLASLEKIQDQIQNERTREVEERNNIEIDRLKNLKETWKRHQDTAKSIIKTISQRHTVEYVEKVPFKGDPDNTLLICDEFVVFDAKSPGGETLGNFSNYLKDQAEKAKKYAKQADVKTDIFFVVPSNTLDYISTFVYRHGDHNVYIISIDALEPIILSLKKIEEYEFVDQLSPEDRESICRILGRFAHLSKRRIQVDSFFAKQFIELAYKCETDLQPDILKSVVEFERSEKLNPPIEKRAKTIALAEIEIDTKKINQEAEIRGIIIQDENISNLLNELPLYKSPDGLN